MSTEAVIQLAVLALIDSTSIGTLVIPVWLLLRKNSRDMLGKVSFYLGIVGAFYFAIGVVLLTGVTSATEIFSGTLRDIAASTWFQWLAFAIGAALIWWGFTPNAQQKAEKLAKGRAKLSPTPPAIGQPSSEGQAHGVVLETVVQQTQSKWQRKITRAMNTRGGLVTLALIAGVLELPTMFPYLGALGILGGSGVGFVASVGYLALYCVIMITPALILLAIRMFFAEKVDSLLTTLSEKLSKYAAEAMQWIAAIIGILIVRWASVQLFSDGFMLPFGN